MDLVTMRSKVRERLGVPASDGLYTDTVLTSLINAALHYIESEADWGWLEAEATITTASADADYDLPARYRSTIGVVNADGFPLDKATAKMHRLLRGASGVPKVWDVLGNQIRLAPTPNAILALTHIYVGGEVDLAADGDEPTMPTVWHQAIVEYATYLAFRRWKSDAEAGSALAAYETWVEQMKAKAPRVSVDEGGGETPAPVEAS